MSWRIFHKLLSLAFAISLLPLIGVGLAWAFRTVDSYFLYICLIYFVLLLVGLFVSAKPFKYVLVIAGICWLIIWGFDILPNPYPLNFLFELQVTVGVVILAGNLRDAVSKSPGVL